MLPTLAPKIDVRYLELSTKRIFFTNRNNFVDSSEQINSFAQVSETKSVRKLKQFLTLEFIRFVTFYNKRNICTVDPIFFDVDVVLEARCAIILRISFSSIFIY